MAGDVEILLGDEPGVLHTAQLNVVLGGFSQHRQQHTASVVLGDFQVGVGRFGFPPHAAPEIQLPGSGKAGIPQVEGGLAIVS
ncbi:hypothetical protein D3C81_1546310 [compost metagenome]